MVAAAKLLVLNPGEFELWKIRIEQYFLMTDYALWEVIVNGDSPPPKRIVDGVEQTYPPATAEEKLARKNELKARDEIVIKEWEDRMERAAIIASSLETEQDSGNINRTQSMTTLNESFPQGTDSGSGPRCQDTILGGVEAQIRFEAVSKQSNDPPLSRVNTLGSGEDSIKLKELIEFCTKLSKRALDL
ncbi:hypothetical protein Tco_1045830 [Tanacetum coccineum]|uniref:Uncharacterized protein n=1 Tax=Tanacetum coccineum TaxID=301880 RepID=A0ABQ5GUR5_9ASTR